MGSNNTMELAWKRSPWLSTKHVTTKTLYLVVSVRFRVLSSITRKALQVDWTHLEVFEALSAVPSHEHESFPPRRLRQRVLEFPALQSKDNVDP